MILKTKEYDPCDVQSMVEHIMKTYQLSECELIQLLNVSNDTYYQFLNGSFYPDCYMKLLLLHTFCKVTPTEKLRALVVQIKTELSLPTDVIAKLAGMPERTLIRFLENIDNIDAVEQCKLYAVANTMLSILNNSKSFNDKVI